MFSFQPNGVDYRKHSRGFGVANPRTAGATSDHFGDGFAGIAADRQAGFDGAADVLELLAALPTPEEILNLRASPRLAARVAEMVEKSRAGAMAPQDDQEWERYEDLEHLARMAKGAAQLKVSRASSDG